MSCNHEWSEECYDVVPSQVCVRCNAFQVEEEHAVLVRDAYKRGAEAMREACAQWFREHDESFELTVDACHDVIADMPIPEEP